MIVELCFASLGDVLGVMPTIAALHEREPVKLRTIGAFARLRTIFPADIPVFYDPTIAGARDEEPPVNQDGYARFDLHGAHRFCAQRGLYMSQGYQHQVGLQTPAVAPRPALVLNERNDPGISGDVGLAPFGYSGQLWQREKWQALVDAFPGVRFVLYGDTARDDEQYVVGRNVTPFFGYSIEQTALSIRSLRYGLVSICTGLSHLAYAVGQKNVLLYDEDSWGVQPDAIGLHQRVETIAVAQVVDALADVLLERDNGARR